MRNIVLECTCSKDKEIHNGYSFYGNVFCSGQSFVIFYDNEFIFLKVPSCVKGYDSDCDFVLRVLNNSKKKDGYVSIHKSMNLDKEFREFVEDGKIHKKFIIEVNYLYYNNACRKYSICSKWKYIDYILLQDKRNIDYEKTLKFIDENKDFEWARKQVTDLYYDNYYRVSDYEFIRNTNELIKQINKVK